MSTLLAVFETSGLFDTIMSVIGTILYPLFAIIFVVIDGVQHIFYAFAGIDKMSFNGQIIGNGDSGLENDSGIVYFLMNHDIVKNLIMSILLLALFLIVVFTVMAFIKNVYAAKPKSWKDIIGNAFKGLANFIFLPVCCLLGVWVGNILLKAIDGATSYKGSSSMGRKLFIASSYNANLFRCTDGWGVTWGDLEWLLNHNMLDENKTFMEYHGITLQYTDRNDRVLEKLPDNATDTEKAKREEEKAYYAELVDQAFAETDISLISHGRVGSYYSLWQVNYLVLIVGGIFMLYILGSLAFGMVRRLFLILALFVISPGVCSLYPLDEGKAVGSWKTKFIEQVLSAYGAIAGMNIFYSLLPLIDRLSMFDGSVMSGGWGGDEIVQLFVMVTGLMIVKEFISLISGFVGGEDAYGKGSSLMKSASKEVGGRVGKTITAGVGVFSKASAAHKDGKSFMGSLFKYSGEALLDGGKGALKTLTGGALDFKAFKEAKKGGKPAYEEDKAKAEAKEMAKEFEKVLDKFKDLFTKDDKGNIKGASTEGIAQMLKEASYRGIDESKAYDMIQKQLAAGGVNMSKPDMRREVYKYNQQKEEEKMQRMAAYNARGADYEKELDANIVTIKADEAKINDAKLAQDAATTSPQFVQWQTEAQKAIEKAMNNLTPKGSKKGDTERGRKDAVAEMQRIVESGETSSSLDPSKFSGVFKDAITNFNKELERASESITKVAEASEAVKAAEEAKVASIKQLDATVQKVSADFSTVQEKVDKFGATTGKTSKDLEDLVKDVKKEMRGPSSSS